MKSKSVEIKDSDGDTLSVIHGESRFGVFIYSQDDPGGVLFSPKTHPHTCAALRALMEAMEKDKKP